MGNETISGTQPARVAQPMQPLPYGPAQIRYNAAVVLPPAGERPAASSDRPDYDAAPDSNQPLRDIYHQTERSGARKTIGDSFKAAIKEGQKEGGKMLGTVGGVFEGVSDVLAAPYRSGRKPGLVGIPMALISGMLTLVGKFFTGSGAIWKATKGETIDRLKPATYAIAEERYQELSKECQDLQNQVNTLRDQIAIKEREVKASADSARPISSSITTGDVEGLEKVRQYEKLAKELEDLAEELKEKQEKLKAQEKRMKKAQERLAKANANIPQEASRGITRAERAHRSASRIMGEV